MRLRNIKTTMRFPILTNRLDQNGCVYSTQAVKMALTKRTEGLPLVFVPNNGEERVIGMVTSNFQNVEEDKKTGVISAELDGILFFGGTSEIVVRQKENGEIEDFQIVSVGISEI